MFHSDMSRCIGAVGQIFLVRQRYLSNNRLTHYRRGRATEQLRVKMTGGVRGLDVFWAVAELE